MVGRRSLSAKCREVMSAFGHGPDERAQTIPLKREHLYSISMGYDGILDAAEGKSWLLSGSPQPTDLRC
jgi:hypothetical protein